MNAKSNAVLSEEAPAAAVGKKPRPAKQPDAPAHPLAQLELFGLTGDPGALDSALDAADRVDAATAKIVAQTPALAAQLKEPGAKEKLDFARFMRAATAPHEVVRQALTETVDASDADAVMEQLAAVERAEAAGQDPVDGEDAAEELPKKQPVPKKRATFDTKDVDPTRMYIANLQGGRYAPMSPEREAELGRKSLAGDMTARAELIERNMRFAVSMARRYIKTGRPFDDLIQAASEGLITAAAKFNPDLGRFTTNAAWWIRQAVQRAVQKDDNVPTPAYLPFQEAKLLRQAAKADTEEERDVLTAKASGAAKRLAVRRKPSVSLDQSMDGEEDGNDMLSLLVAEEPGQEERAEGQKIVGKIIELSKRLGDARMTNIFLMRVGMHPDHLGESLSLGEIVEVCQTVYGFKLTRERVRQIYTEAADDIATAMEYWAKGADNLPLGFRKGLMSPGRS
jgi:RNA polymerase sigma factor (sigma-70 family)